MRQSDKDELVEFAVSAVKNFNKRLAITPHIIQKKMSITSPKIAREVLVGLYHRKVLLKPGSGNVYYINHNPPSALSPILSYSSKF